MGVAMGWLETVGVVEMGARVGRVAAGLVVGWVAVAMVAVATARGAREAEDRNCPAACLWIPPCLSDPLVRCRTALRCPTQPSHCWQGCYPAHPRMLARCL